MWTRNLCLICIYILRNNAFQMTNEASFLAFLQPAATRLKFLLSSSSRLSKTFSAYSFTVYTPAPFRREFLVSNLILNYDSSESYHASKAKWSL